MSIGKSDWFWTVAAIILVAIIVIGGLYIWSKFTPGESVEINLAPEQELSGSIYVGGAVNNPGYYALRSDDSIETLVQIAGGLASSANASLFRLYATTAGEGQEPQKVDINRADSRLLQSLPGIGETRAQHIIDYRQQNGPFSNINELLKVSGIGTATLEDIEDLITVVD